MDQFEILIKSWTNLKVAYKDKNQFNGLLVKQNYSQYNAEAGHFISKATIFELSTYLKP